MAPITAWDLKPGVKFISKGAARRVYRVVWSDAFTLKLEHTKNGVTGTVIIARESVLNCIDAIL